MSITSIVNAGLSALLANQTALRATSSNIANVNSPDYARRVVSFETMTAGDLLGGVRIADVTRAIDRFVEVARLESLGRDGAAATAADYLDQLQRSLGRTDGDSNPAARLNAVTSSLASLAGDPASTPNRLALLQQLNLFAQSISQASARIQTLRAQADAEIRGGVTRANELIQTITQLNTTVQQATLAGDSATPSRDARDAAVRELAALIDIKSTESPDGRITVTTGSGYTLVGANPAELQMPGASGAGPSAFYDELLLQRRNGVTGVPVGPPETFETHLAGGSLRGLLDLRNTMLPKLASELSTLASGAAEALNAAHNASTAWPAPSVLTGRNTGLLASDSLGFTGRASLAVTNPLGQLVRRIDIDFAAGTLSVDGGAPAALGGTIGSFSAALNTALAGTGSASFTNGVLTLSATGGNGVAIGQDSVAPSARAGRGFAHTFGLNDLYTLTPPPANATGLAAGDAHGFLAGGEAAFAVRAANGAITAQFTYTVGGTSMTDLVTGLNAAAAGAGSFALDAQGRLTFTASGGATQTLEITGDSTERGAAGGVSLTRLFGLGLRAAMEPAESMRLRPEINGSPARLATAQLDLSGTPVIGDLVLASGDNRGAQALIAATGPRAFPASGNLGAVTATLGSYAASVLADIGQRAAAASVIAEDAAAMRDDIATRAGQASGVNLDEELSNMIAFQQAYNAGARLITTAQKLYDELMNMTR